MQVITDSIKEKKIRNAYFFKRKNRFLKKSVSVYLFLFCDR